MADFDNYRGVSCPKCGHLFSTFSEAKPPKRRKCPICKRVTIYGKPKKQRPAA